MGSFGITGAIVSASKLAFMGWGIGIRELDFTGFSGHSALFAVFWPIFLWLLCVCCTDGQGSCCGRSRARHCVHEARVDTLSNISVHDAVEHKLGELTQKILAAGLHAAGKQYGARRTAANQSHP